MIANMPLKFAFVFLGFYVCLVAAGTSLQNSEEAAGQEILDRLLEGYNPNVPPVGHNGQGSPVKVYITMFFLDIFKVDDFNMDFKTQFYFRRMWKDPRLQFKNKNVKLLKLNDVSKIWIPDLFFAEEKEGRHHNLAVPNTFIRIGPEGDILFSIRLSVTFGCPLDLRRYPHDIHKCKFSIESYSYDASRVVLGWASSAENISYKAVEVYKDIDVKDFHLLDIESSVRHISLHTGNYSVLGVSLSFQRKAGFFLLRLFTPFILLVVLSWITFWMKPQLVVLRLTLLIVILYLMVNIGADINSYIPPAAYTKGSDVWIACCQSLVFGAMLEFILVSYLSHRETSGNGNLRVESHDGEGKKDSPLKTESLDSSARFVAQNLCKLRWSERVEMISRVLFPLLFIFFNIVYWSVYCRRN